MIHSDEGTGATHWAGLCNNEGTSVNSIPQNCVGHTNRDTKGNWLLDLGPIRPIPRVVLARAFAEHENDVKNPGSGGLCIGCSPF